MFLGSRALPVREADNLTADALRLHGNSFALFTLLRGPGSPARHAWRYRVGVDNVSDLEGLCLVTPAHCSTSFMV
jgi:hypothetical protein